MGKYSTYVQAQPGWAIVVPSINEEGFNPVIEIHHEPVILWEIKEEPLIVVEPVTIEGSGTKDKIIRRPDGTYKQPYSKNFDSEEEVIKYLQEKYEKTGEM